MVDVDFFATSIGIIFNYPNPMAKRDIVEKLKKDFKIFEEQKLTIEKTIEVNVNLSNKIAEKDNVSIIYNPHANITGFPKCSFITVKIDGEDFKNLFSNTEKIMKLLKSLKVDDQISCFELVMEGRAKVNSEYLVSKFFNTSSLELFKKSFESEPIGNALKIESDIPPNNAGWFRFILDTSFADNPNFWGIRFVKRFKSTAEIKMDSIKKNLISIIESVK